MKGILFNIQKFSLHDGAGIRTTLFFKGCNLRCRWCANPESQKMEPEQLGAETTGRAYTLEEVLAEAMRDKPFYDRSGGGVTLSGGEPLLQADFAAALCRQLRERGVNVSMETAACVPLATFQKVFPLLDSAHIDLKHYDPAKHQTYTGVDNQQILENIAYALSQPVPVVLRVPVIPGFNDAPADMEAFRALFHRLGAKSVQLLPFHQMGESKYAKMGLPYAYAGVPQLHEEDLNDLAAILGRTANPLAALIPQGSHPNGLHPPKGRLLGVVGHNDQGPTLAVGPNIFHGPQAGIRIQAFKSLVQRQQRGIV